MIRANLEQCCRGEVSILGLIAGQIYALSSHGVTDLVKRDTGDAMVRTLYAYVNLVVFRQDFNLAKTHWDMDSKTKLTLIWSLRSSIQQQLCSRVASINQITKMRVVSRSNDHSSCNLTLWVVRALVVD